MKFLFEDSQDFTWRLLSLRSILFAILTILTWQFINYSYMTAEIFNHFLHLPNLIFHEAGHVFFYPFGAFIASLGGTLGQLLIPLICLLVLFIKSRDPFGGFVCLWWFGQNFLDIAPYVFDATFMKVPLVGGIYGHSAPYGVHDWNFILSESGLLSYYSELAMAAYIIGVIIMLASLIGAAQVLINHFRNIKKIEN